MAPHSNTLVWKIPWAEESGRLQSMGLLRVGHDWASLLSLFTFMHWSGKWQPTLVFLPWESQGRGSLVGCHLWGHTDWLDWLKLFSSSSASHCFETMLLPACQSLYMLFWLAGMLSFFALCMTGSSHSSDFSLKATAREVFLNHCI